MYIQYRVLASVGKDLKGSVFLEALAEREEANRNGKMTVKAFLLVPHPWNDGLK